MDRPGALQAATEAFRLTPTAREDRITNTDRTLGWMDTEETRAFCRKAAVSSRGHSLSEPG